jgi:hypothetical protein
MTWPAMCRSAGYGAEGKPSLHPLDSQLNLPVEKYSHEVRRRVAIEAAKNAFDEGVKTLENFTGAHIPKRQFEELVVRAAHDFDDYWKFHGIREYEGNHAAHYANQQVPDVNPPNQPPCCSKSKLKLIKK